MKKSQFTDQQIAFAVQQAEAGVAVEEVCRKLGISQQTFYRWKKQYAGMGVAELRKMNEVLEKRVIERTESMRRTAESLRAIFQASPLAVIELDLDGHVLMWNPAAECLFGWKQKEILNLPNPIIPEDQQEEALSLRERALRGESFAMLETVRQDFLPLMFWNH